MWEQCNVLVFARVDARGNKKGGERSNLAGIVTKKRGIGSVRSISKKRCLSAGVIKGEKEELESRCNLIYGVGKAWVCKKGTRV